MIFYLIVLDLYTHDPHKNEIPLSDIEVLRLVIQINGQVRTANCKLKRLGCQESG